MKYAFSWIALLSCISFMIPSPMMAQIEDYGSAGVRAKVTDGQIYIVEVPGKEIGFLIGYNPETKEFSKYYVFQYEWKKAILSRVLTADIAFLSADQTKLKVRVGKDDIYVFSIDEKYSAGLGEVVIYGYGLAEYNAGKKPFKLLPMQDINEVNDSIEK